MYYDSKQFNPNAYDRGNQYKAHMTSKNRNTDWKDDTTVKALRQNIIDEK